MTTEHGEPTETDRAAIAALTQRVAAAWAEHDADAFADAFTEDATMILTGVFCDSRAAARDFLAGAFRGPFRGTRVVGTPISVRLLSDDVAILLSRGGVVAPGDDEPTPERAIHASWVLVRHGDGWRLAAYQNTPVNSPW